MQELAWAAARVPVRAPALAAAQVSERALALVAAVQASELEPAVAQVSEPVLALVSELVPASAAGQALEAETEA